MIDVWRVYSEVSRGPRYVEIGLAGSGGNRMAYFNVCRGISLVILGCCDCPIDENSIEVSGMEERFNLAQEI